MTFDTAERSLEGGRPIEIYEFAVGPTVHRWTSAEDVVSFGGNDYDPTPISRGAYRDGEEERDHELEVRVPSNNPIAQFFIHSAPDQRIHLTVTRIHRGEAGSATIFKGTVRTCSFVDNLQTALIRAVRPVASPRPIPRQTFAGLCGHVLGDARCQVVLADFTYTGQVTAVSDGGRLLTIDGLLAAKGDGWATGGKARFGGTARLILSQSGDDVRLLAPFGSSPLGKRVEAVAGCSHTAEECALKFGALERFSGWPFVPTVNVFETGLEG